MSARARALFPVSSSASMSAGRPLFLWPFGRKRMGPITVAGFLGSKHASFNVGLWRAIWRPRSAQATSATCWRGLRRRHASICSPFTISPELGRPRQPFASLPRQVSARRRVSTKRLRGRSDRGGREPAMRSRLRIKERKLKKLAGYGYIQAASAADIDRCSMPSLAQGRSHARARPHQCFCGTRRARVSCARPAHQASDGRPLNRAARACGRRRGACLYGAIVDAYRFSAMFNTYTLGAQAGTVRPYPAAAHDRSLCAARHAQLRHRRRPRPLQSFFCRSRSRCSTPSFRSRRAGGWPRPASAPLRAKRMIKAKPALRATVHSCGASAPATPWRRDRVKPIRSRRQNTSAVKRRCALPASSAGSAGPLASMLTSAKPSAAAARAPRSRPDHRSGSRSALLAVRIAQPFGSMSRSAPA